MKRKLALVLAVVLVLSQMFSMTTVFAAKGKKVAVIKYTSDLGNGKKIEDMVTCGRPNPKILPEYSDGSKDEGIVLNNVKDLYYDTGVIEILSLAYYDENEVLGDWIPISKTQYSKYGGPIPDSVKINDAAGSNVWGDIDLDLDKHDINTETGEVTETLDTTPVEEASEWAKTSIETLKEMGLIKDELFKNYGYNISREDFAYLSVVLSKELGASYIPGVYQADLKTFNDTQNEDVLKAYKMSIVNGYGNGKFGPADPVTREQIDVMLIKAMENAKVTLNKNGASSIVFKDHDQVSSWAMESVQLAYHNKIMNGVAELTIAPKNNTTREQALVLVFNILNNEEFNKNK